MRKDHEDIYEEFKGIFAQEGLDRIEERLAILRAFLDTEGHVTASDLTKKLKDQGVFVSEGFVSENLKFFTRYGYARERDFSQDIPRYEHRHLGSHHDHIVCERCGAILEFCNPKIEALQAQQARRMGFRDVRHRMEIYGLCSRCQRERGEIIPLTMASRGERVCIVGFDGGKGAQRRLSAIGLRRGAEVEVINGSGPGPIILACGMGRIALGFGMAKRILVRPVTTCERDQ